MTEGTDMRLYTRCSGAGPLVVCLHSSAGSGQQWQALAETLAPRFRVACVDLHGHGRSPAPDAGVHVLAQDAAWLAPTIAAATDGVHLVAHSYGAALAVRLALAHPARVRSLALFEPVLFSLLDDPQLPGSAREEIGQVGRAIVAWVKAGQPVRAARGFIDYWSAIGGWHALGARQQRAIAARMPVVAAHFDALFGAGITLRHVARLAVPTLLMSGGRSRRASLAIAEALQAAWPQAKVRRFEALGHLGPITDAATVNAEIVRHLEHVADAKGALPPRTRVAGLSIMRPGEGNPLSVQGVPAAPQVVR
jgi:pimeloyl-ACP methyl ester carboxylesterase